MTFSDEMRRALELDARKLEALGQDPGPTLPNGNHTDGEPLCQRCGHPIYPHGAQGCLVGHTVWADEDRSGYDPEPCPCPEYVPAPEKPRNA